MNIKRLHLDRKILLHGLEAHFPPGCWGLNGLQRVYISTRHEIRVGVGECFFIKGKEWIVSAVEFIPFVGAQMVELRLFPSLDS